MSISVAPHAGALVETMFQVLFCHLVSVAPHAGALVETLRGGAGMRVTTSRLTQAR